MLVGVVVVGVVMLLVFNRPIVAGAVLQTPLILIIAELQIQILPLIENLEWLYIWGFVVRSTVRHRRRSVGRSVGGFEDCRMGDLWGS